MEYKQVIINHHGGTEVLQLVENEVPEPVSGELRVKILATVASFTDILIREGLYPGVPKPPFSPGYEIVGIVDKLGDGVSNLQLGQRVVALRIVGGYSEFICIAATELIQVPESVDAVAAVCLPLHYVTAYQMLHRIAAVKSSRPLQQRISLAGRMPTPQEFLERSNQRILIHGAAGGVGTALLQLGKLAGLEMYGTASQPKHELVSSLGGIPIDYKNEDFVQTIRTLTSDGVDVVFDPIGGGHLLNSYKTLRRGGMLISYGVSAALAVKQGRFLIAASTFALLPLLQIIPDNRQAVWYNIEALKKQHPNWFREDLTKLLNLLAQKQINPIIAERLPLAEVARAHLLLEKSAVSGKLILTCNDG